MQKNILIDYNKHYTYKSKKEYEKALEEITSKLLKSGKKNENLFEDYEKLLDEYLNFCDSNYKK